MEAGPDSTDSKVQENTDPNFKDIKECFGEYLTNQYGVLERTLSYLMIKDLQNASLVCKSWNQVTNRLLRKRRRLMWHLKCKKNCPPNHCYKNKINFISQLILNIKMQKSKNTVIEELKESKTTAGAPVIPGLVGSMIMIQVDDAEIPYYTKNEELKFLTQEDVAIFFPVIDGCKIKIVVLKESSQHDENGFIANFYHNNEAPKGILTFTKNADLSCIETAFTQIIDSSSSTVALGGGMFSKIRAFSPRGPERDKTNNDIYNILFYGENVTCYSNILEVKGKLATENFMETMKKELGSYDLTKQQRIAIAIRCIGRSGMKYEKELFKKYFPDVPAFTFVSYGECGYHTVLESSENEVPKKKQKCGNVPIMYSYSVVYFFITVNLVD